ncbi:hypothetical protein ACFLVH_04350 [Chloroflexota bacterium]
MTTNNSGENLGRLLKQRRLMVLLTLHEMAAVSGISSLNPGSATISRKLSDTYI